MYINLQSLKYRRRVKFDKYIYIVLVFAEFIFSKDLSYFVFDSFPEVVRTDEFGLGPISRLILHWM